MSRGQRSEARPVGPRAAPGGRPCGTRRHHEVRADVIKLVAERRPGDGLLGTGHGRRLHLDRNDTAIGRLDGRIQFRPIAISEVMEPPGCVRPGELFGDLGDDERFHERSCRGTRQARTRLSPREVSPCRGARRIGEGRQRIRPLGAAPSRGSARTTDGGTDRSVDWLPGIHRGRPARDSRAGSASHRGDERDPPVRRTLGPRTRQAHRSVRPSTTAKA